MLRVRGIQIRLLTDVFNVVLQKKKQSLLGHFRALGLRFSPLDYIPTLPPHSTNNIVSLLRLRGKS